MDAVLITGARGLIGRACVSALAARGRDVVAITSGAVPPDHAGLRWRGCDLLEPGAPEALIASERPSTLLHLAWTTTPGAYWTSPENATWLDASRRLLDAFAAHDGRRVVAAGTCAEYDWRAGTLHERSTPRLARSPYVRAKAALGDHLETLGASAAWARIFFAYGPGEPRTKLVASIVDRLGTGAEAACGDGGRRRDFIHVDDVAGALVALVEGTVTGAVNVGTGAAASVGAVARTIARLMDADDRLRVGAEGSSDEAPLVVADTGRLRTEVGFAPAIDLETGLRSCVEAAARTGVTHDAG
jgi:nucleoside-diphosphate-sugar epimerase